MAKKIKKADVLAELLSTASRDVLTNLILSLAFRSPENRRECFDYLRENVSVSKALHERSEGEIVLALWYELEPDLEDLDTYGGGDYAVEDHVAELLQQIQERLNIKSVDLVNKRKLLKQVLPYIESNNAGMDDLLYEVAYAEKTGCLPATRKAPRPRPCITA